MADKQVGNIHGVTSVLGTRGRFIGNVTADGVNTVTLDNVKGLSAGDQIDIVNTTDDSELASNRNVSNISDAGVVTYSGADVAATTDHAVYLIDSSQSGFVEADALTIEDMRARLAAIDAGLYTSDYLDQMTYNDMLYAIRLSDSVIR